MGEMSNPWDDRYTMHTAAFGVEPNDFLVAHAKRIPRDSGPVLCIGDGQGRNGVHLAALGFEVVSIDLSPVGLDGAQRLAAERQVSITTVVADLAGYHPPADCAAVVSIFCHLPTAVRTLAYPRLIAALRPGGVWIHESYAPGQIGRGTGGPSDPDMLASVAQLRHQLAGLTHLIAHELVRPVVEGPLHTGEAEVVQYLGAVGDPRGSDER
jgi:SAM-dependent methyltransferase